MVRNLEPYEGAEMLEGILLTVVLGYVFSYVALAIIHWVFDRPMTPEKRQRLIQEQMSTLERGQ